MYKLLSIKYLKKLSILVLLVTCYLLPVASVSAQETQRAITIVPPNVQKSLNPGERTEGIMKVINDSAEPLTFNVFVRDYIVVDTKGTPNLLPPDTLNEKYSASSWLGVYPSTFTVMPHEKQILNYYLQVPLDARPGGHYAAVVYTPENAGGPSGTGASVQTQIGTLFYVSVNGDITERSIVSKIFADPFSEYGPVKILTQIKNLGDLHVKPEGKVAIYDLLGRNIGNQKLSEFNIFPGGVARDYENTFGQKIMIGRFKATLLASYGKGNNLPLMATVYFWVFPWKIALVVTLLIIAAILGGMYWKKKKTRINTDQKQINTDSSSKQNA